MASLLRTKRFGWGVTFLLVTAVALLSYFSGTRYLAAMRAVEQTLAVESAINGTLSLLKDAETGQRGYILTADPNFLEPYETALKEIPPHFARLVAVTGDDAQQTPRVARLREFIAQKHAFIAETIRLRREGDEERALVRVRSGRGKQIMDYIRAECRAMLEHEERVLEARKSAAQQAERTAMWGVGIGSLLTVLLALFSLLTVHRDVGAMKRAAEELAASEEHYRMLTEQSSDLVRLLGANGAVTYVSPSVERLLGYSVEEYLALPPRALMHPDEVALGVKIMSDIQAGTQREGVSTYRLRNKLGDYRWFEVHWAVRRGADGKMRELHTVGRDVTARLESERRLSAYATELKSLSLHDELTKLYNRRGFIEVAGQAHAEAQRNGHAAALIFVDLNGMKRINDELGHDAGDLALVDTAALLLENLRPADVIARLGGDEFVAFAVEFSSRDLERLRARLRERADARVIERERSFRLSMSVGAAYLLPGSERSLNELLDDADAAMYEQKNARRAAGGISVPPAPVSRR